MRVTVSIGPGPSTFVTCRRLPRCQTDGRPRSDACRRTHLAQRDDAREQLDGLLRERKDLEKRIYLLVVALETAGDIASLAAKLRAVVSYFESRRSFRVLRRRSGCPVRRSIFCSPRVIGRSWPHARHTHVRKTVLPSTVVPGTIVPFA